MFGEGITTVVEGLARIYHIERQSRSNDLAISSLEEKVSSVEAYLTQLNSLSGSGLISLSGINETVRSIRDYIKRYRNPSLIKQSMKLLRVDKLSEAIESYAVDLNQQIELLLLQLNVNVHVALETQIVKQDQVLAAVQRIEDKVDANRVPDEVHVHEKTFFLENTSLVDQHTAKVHKRLRDWYLRDVASHVSLDVGDEVRTMSVGEIFVNLAVVEENVQREDEKIWLAKHYGDQLQATSKREEGFFSAMRQDARAVSVLEKQQAEPNAYEPFAEQNQIGSSTVRKEVDLESLFDHLKSSTTSDDLNQSVTNQLRQILMLGRAGVGKTTLCLNLLNRWAKGVLWQNKIHWVFHFELKKVANCRALENENKVHKILYEMVLRHFEDLISESQSEAFWQMLLKQGHTIAIILDGYDEVSDRQHPACEALMSIVEDHPEATHLIKFVTSRPYAKIIGKMDLILENIGFKDENIPLYIQKYFAYVSSSTAQIASAEEDDDTLSEALSSQQLTVWLAERLKIKQLCRVPIHLELLCSVWKMYNKKIMGEDLVISDLYALMVEKIIRRYLRKTLSDYRIASLLLMSADEVIALEESREILKFLKSLAYEGLKTGNIIIQKELFRKVAHAQGEKFYTRGAMQRLLSTGFLKAVGDSSEDPLNMDYHFIHLSFQEYIAAMKFADDISAEQVSQETKQFITKHRQDPTYQLVWTYTGGVLRDNEEGFKRFFALLAQAPRDLFGMYELALLVRCAEEAKWPPYPTLYALLDYLGKWTMSISRLDVRNQRHAQHFLSHLRDLYLACPNAMSKVRYNGKMGLLNVLMHESRDIDVLDDARAILDRIFAWANIGFYIVQVMKDSLAMKASNEAANTTLRLLFSIIFGTIKFISVCSYMAIFAVGNVPLVAFLFQYRYYKEMQSNAIEFMTNFEFNDSQAVMRLLAMLSHPDPKTRLRMLNALVTVQFAENVAPLVYKRVYHLFISDPDYEVRTACYEQLLSVYPKYITHNEPLFYFNFCVQHVSLGTEVFYTRSLNEKLRKYYPEELVKSAENLLTIIKSKNVLSRYPILSKQRKRMGQHFCLELLRQMTPDINDEKIKLIIQQYLIPIVTWQYVDLRYPKDKEAYVLAISDVVTLGKGEDMLALLLRVLLAMEAKKVPPIRAMNQFKEIWSSVSKKIDTLKSAMQDYLKLGASTNTTCLKIMDAVVHDQPIDNDIEQQSECVEIKAFAEPYQAMVSSHKRKMSISSKRSAANSSHQSLFAESTGAALAESKKAAKVTNKIDQPVEVMNFYVIVDTLNSSTDTLKIIQALSQINPLHMNDEDKDELVLALLQCINRIKNRRYSYYFLPRVTFGYVISFLALWIASVLLSCFVNRWGLVASVVSAFPNYATYDQEFSYKFQPETTTFAATCTVQYYMELFNNTLPTWAVSKIMWDCLWNGLVFLTMQLLWSAGKAILAKNYEGGWGADYQEKVRSNRLYYETLVFSTIDLLTFRSLSSGLYLFTCGYSSVKKLQEYTDVLVKCGEVISHDTLFSQVLAHYPNYLGKDSQAVFYRILRDTLSSSTTAIWRESFNEFVWYKGRKRFSITCDHPLRLVADIKSVRLLDHYFGWFQATILQNCFNSKEQDVFTYEVNKEESEISERPSFIQQFGAFAGRRSNSMLGTEMVTNPMAPGISPSNLDESSHV